MTSSPELPVPDAALTALHEAKCGPLHDLGADVRAIAGPVVAAVLMDLSQQLDGDPNRRDVPADVAAWWAGRADAARVLREVAAELESPVSSR